MADDYEYGLMHGQQQTTAADFYSSLSAERQNVEDTAEELAKITIPAIFPPGDYVEGDRLYVPNQSETAQMVNNLCNALAYLAFPPGQPMLAYTIAEHKVDTQQLDPAAAAEVYSKLMLALSRIEVVHRTRFEATILRARYVEFLKLLAVTGNGLWRHYDLDFPTIHSMRHYVVRRDSYGRPCILVLKECVDRNGLKRDVQEFIVAHEKSGGQPTSYTDDKAKYNVDIYTCVRWDYEEDKWYHWQELSDGAIIPDTEESGDSEDKPCPLYPAQMIMVDGKNWGRAFCEEYRGDLYNIENEGRAIMDIIADMSRSFTMVDPAGLTRITDIQTVDNGQAIPGREIDVAAYKSQKQQDLNAVTQHAQGLSQRLGKVFLMYASIQRQGERVTKEEIVRLSQDIDKAAGGLHTAVSQTTQKAILMRAIWLHHQEDRFIPKIPKDVVRVSVVTGVDALGRSIDWDNLLEWAQGSSAVLTPAAMAGRLNIDDFLRRGAALKGIKPEGLVKDAATVEAETQQQNQQGMIAGAAPGVAQEAAKAGFGAMAQAALSQQGVNKNG